jgi:DNA-binding transcriptional LysR family regulator
MDRLKAMEAFVRIVDLGSFSAAATKMGVSNGVLSKHLTKLEQFLGARLLNRSTRHTSLTNIGREYYEFCVRILNDLRNQEAAIANLHGEMSGEIKVLVSKGFGNLHMGQATSDFMRLYPEIRVDLTLCEDTYIRSHSMIENGYDVAIRLSKIEEDSRIVARRIGTYDWIICASPRYLDEKGEPKELRELGNHKLLVSAKHAPDGFWICPDDENVSSLRLKTHLKANSFAALRRAALDGHGIALLPTYCVGSDLQQGTLRQVLADFALTEQVFAVLPHRALMPKKIQAFVKFMGKLFQEANWRGPDSQKRLPQDEVKPPTAKGSGFLQ